MDDFSERIQPADSSGDLAGQPVLTPLPIGLQVISIVAILLGISGSLAAMLRSAGLIEGLSAQASLDPASEKLSAEAQVVVEMTPRLILVAIYVGLAVSVLLLLAKMILYTFVVVCLRGPRVRVVFGMDLAPAEIA